LLLAVALSGCATTRNKGDVADLKPTVEAFHRHLRWKDFRGATDFMVQEKRAGFIKARLERNDDRDLTVSDYTLEDCTIAGDQRTADCISRLNWIRLPSVSETSEVVTCKFAWDGHNWKLYGMENGPFQPELAHSGPPPTLAAPPQQKLPDVEK
jgi:hypothetical protein